MIKLRDNTYIQIVYKCYTDHVTNNEDLKMNELEALQMSMENKYEGSVFEDIGSSAKISIKTERVKMKQIKVGDHYDAKILVKLDASESEISEKAKRNYRYCGEYFAKNIHNFEIIEVDRVIRL